MTPERIEQERAKFEEWYYDSIGDTRFPLDKYENGCYCNPNAEDMFTAWCAAKSRAAQSEWISVEDRLPEIGTRVLLCGRYEGKGIIAYCAIGYFDGKTYREHWGADINATAAITHWQPLPEPPETRGK